MAYCRIFLSIAVNGSYVRLSAFRMWIIFLGCNLENCPIRSEWWSVLLPMLSDGKKVFVIAWLLMFKIHEEVSAAPNRPMFGRIFFRRYQGTAALQVSCFSVADQCKFFFLGYNSCWASWTFWSSFPLKLQGAILVFLSVSSHVVATRYWICACSTSGDGAAMDSVGSTDVASNVVQQWNFYPFPILEGVKFLGQYPGALYSYIGGSISCPVPGDDLPNSAILYW